MEDYLEQHGIGHMIQTMVQELRSERPVDPAGLMVQCLKDNYVKKKENSKKRTAQEYADEAMEEGCYAPQEPERSFFAVPDSLKRKRRGAICCDVPKVLPGFPLTQRIAHGGAPPKSSETRAGLEKVLAKNVMFAHLEGDQLAQIFTAMFEVHYKESDIVFRQGDEGDNFYVVEKGECDVFTMKGGASQHVAAYMEGSAFGELALIYDSPRTSTVKARTDVVLWAIDRVAFRSIVTETTMRTRKIYETFLEKVPILAHLTKCELATVADSLTTEQYWDGEVIFKQDDMGDKFYIIVEGAVEISRYNEPLGRLSVSQYFGEIALLTNRPRSATIAAVGNTKCVYLDRDSFNRLLGPIEDILRRNMEMYNLYISSNI